MLHRVALALVLAALAGCSIDQAEARPSLNFKCEGGSRFTVEFSSPGVTVILPDRSLHMLPKAFHLGERYVSDSGTLIIDHDFASLVLNDDLSFQACTLSGETSNAEQTKPR